MITKWRSTLVLLSSSQALSQSISIFVLTLSAVAAGSMSPNPDLATIPISALILGTLLGLFPTARLMARRGRRSGFRLTIVSGFIGAGISLAGMAAQSFWIFAFGHLFMGVQQGAFQYLRFAAAEIVPEQQRSRAISLVLAGGIVAAFLGPWLAHFARIYGLGAGFGAAYLPLIIIYIIMLGIFLMVPRLDNHEADTAAIKSPSTSRGRGLWEIVRQPEYLRSLTGSAVGYALMILLMTATPVSMQAMGHSSNDTSFIIQWHVLGMYIPSFFTGSLILRWGHRRVLAAGILALLINSIIAVFFLGLTSYWFSLTLLGIGWNFLYIASTARLTTTYQPEERGRAQAFHDSVVFLTSTIATSSAGALVRGLGWQGLNLFSLPIILFAGIIVLGKSPRPKLPEPLEEVV